MTLAESRPPAELHPLSTPSPPNAHNSSRPAGTLCCGALPHHLRPSSTAPPPRTLGPTCTERNRSPHRRAPGSGTGARNSAAAGARAAPRRPADTERSTVVAHGAAARAHRLTLYISLRLQPPGTHWMQTLQAPHAGLGRALREEAVTTGVRRPLSARQRSARPPPQLAPPPALRPPARFGRRARAFLSRGRGRPSRHPRSTPCGHNPHASQEPPPPPGRPGGPNGAIRFRHKQNCTAPGPAAPEPRPRAPLAALLPLRCRAQPSLNHAGRRPVTSIASRGRGPSTNPFRMQSGTWDPPAGRPFTRPAAELCTTQHK